MIDDSETLGGGDGFEPLSPNSRRSKGKRTAGGSKGSDGHGRHDEVLEEIKRVVEKNEVKVDGNVEKVKNLNSIYDLVDQIGDKSCNVEKELKSLKDSHLKLRKQVEYLVKLVENKEPCPSRTS